MRKALILVIIALAACSEQDWESFGGIQYKGADLQCDHAEKSFFLLDIHLRDDKDSILINTIKLGRKLELEAVNMDSSNSLVKLVNAMCVGDSLDVILPLDSFYLAFGGQRPKDLAAGSSTLRIYLVDALSKIKYDALKRVFEKQSMERYVEKFRWSSSYDSSTGIYYESMKSSRSMHQNYKRAKIAYVIKGLNEELLEYSKEDEPLVYESSDQGLIKGIHFIASKLELGERIRAIVPSSMAYGPKGRDRVPAYYPLIIEMELLEILE